MEFAVDPLIGISIATLIGVALILLLKRPTSLQVMVEGSPLFSYYLALPMQLLLFPTLLFLAWADHSYTADWFMSRASLGVYEFTFLCSAAGYFIKDFFVSMQPLLVLHHIACLAAVMAHLYFFFEGVRLFIGGTASLELGSLAFNVSVLGRSDAVNKVSGRVIRPMFILHSLSNVTGAIMLAFYYCNTNIHLCMRYSLVIVGSILIFMRQKECMWIVREAQAEAKLLEKQMRADARALQMQVHDAVAIVQEKAGWKLE